MGWILNVEGTAEVEGRKEEFIREGNRQTDRLLLSSFLKE